jgi:hypothetical protein
MKNVSKRSGSERANRSLNNSDTNIYKGMPRD